MKSFLHLVEHTVDSVLTSEKKDFHTSGFGAIKGKPFWGKCGLYACSRDHEVEHCGLRNVFPCDLFITQYDPENGQTSAFVRAGILSYRKKVGTANYIEMIKKLEGEKIQKSNH